MALRDPTSCWPSLSWLLLQSSLLFLEFYINGITLSALFFLVPFTQHNYFKICM